PTRRSRDLWTRRWNVWASNSLVRRDGLKMTVEPIAICLSALCAEGLHHDSDFFTTPCEDDRKPMAIPPQLLAVCLACDHRFGDFHHLADCSILVLQLYRLQHPPAAILDWAGKLRRPA